MSRTLRNSIASTLVLGAAAFSGCANEATPAPEKGFNIAVAPLSLPGIKDVCYTIEVRNDQGQTVWTQEHICSTQYGDGVGDVSYIGTCDAQEANTTDDGAALNTVTLTIENIYTDAVDPNDYAAHAVANSEWVNPCGTDADSTPISPNGDGFGPCEITEPCVENQDTFIDFNVTVMRSADQGFFDVAVNFEDIFCSAKLDCRNDSDESGVVDTADDYIQLLHNGNDRDDTVVLGFACTAGPGQDTHLYWTDVTVTCGTGDGAVDYVVDPSGGPGNLNIDNTTLFQAATYRGAELLADGFGSLSKRYWNVALGLKAAGQAADCTISAKASAHDGALTDGITPTGTTYPYIEFAANLSTCTQHKMGSDQVKEQYTGLSTQEQFAWFANATDIGATVSPPRRCVEFLAADPNLTDGYYTIDIDGDPATANPSVYCDMANGGWMQILAFDDTETNPSVYLTTLSYFGDTSEIAATSPIATDRGLSWGEKVGSGGSYEGTPTAKQAACFNLNDVRTIDEVKVTVRADEYNGHDLGYMYLLETGHEDDYANMSTFVAGLYHWGFAMISDPGSNDHVNRIRQYDPPSGGHTDVLAVFQTPGLDEAAFTVTGAWPFDTMEFCMVGEYLNDPSDTNYNRRYLQDLWVK